MSSYKLVPEEQETIIRCSTADKEWDVCTADPRFIRRLMKQGYLPEPDHQLSDPFMSFKVPFHRLRPSKKQKRQATGRPFKSQKHADSQVYSS